MSHAGGWPTGQLNFIIGKAKKTMTDLPENCFGWLLKQETSKVNYKEVKVGDILRYNFETYSGNKTSFYLIDDLSVPNETRCKYVDDIRLGITYISIPMLYEWDKVSCDWSKFGVDPTRKDFCHPCQNEKLVWVYMAARCSECNKIILGGC